jgi:hypothetical protein
MGWVSLFEDIRDRRDEAQSLVHAVSQVPEETVISKPKQAEAPKTSDLLDDPIVRRRLRNYWLRSRLSRGQFVSAGNSFIWRGGAQRYTEKIRDIFVRACDRGGLNRALQLDFKISSKGGGETHLSARLTPRDFQPLLQAMLVADRQATLDAIAEELAHHRSS